MKKLIYLLYIISVLCFISGCGKAEILPSGGESYNSSVLNEGIFEPVFIDTSFIGNDFYVSDSRINSDGYDYILTYYDYSSGCNRDYYISFDKAGTTLYSGEISKPIYVNNGNIYISDVASDAAGDINSGPFIGTINYSKFKFDISGGFSSYCQIYTSVYSELLMSSYTCSYGFLVKWNSDGQCISVEDYEIGLDATQGDVDHYILGYDGNKYRTTASGIISLDEDGNYIDKYFDFLNSDIFSYGFNTVNILDSDSFSAVYKNEDNEMILSCFVRKKGLLFGSEKPIVLACTSLDYDLKKAVFAFNHADNGYRITVYDYCDRCPTGSVEESWSLLKESIISGFRPDILLNTSGYDVDFEDQLVADKLLVDLTSVLSHDEALKDINFTNKAKSLFYSNDKIYSIIPSFEYETVVAYYNDFSDDLKWDHEGFLQYHSQNSSVFFFNFDTRQEFLERFLHFDGLEFVDYSNNSASFDSDVFVRYLEFMKSLPVDYNEASELQNADGVGYHYFNEVTCLNLGDMNINSTLKCNGSYKDIGFPSEQGGSGVVNATGSFMIFSNRASTNECWNFIKGFLSDDYQKPLMSGIPVTVSGFISWSNYYYSTYGDPSQVTYFRDGEFYNMEPMNAEKAEYIISCINSCSRFKFSDYGIEQIVIGYAEQFFDGKMTAEEAAKAMDSEVEIYLNKM